MGSGQRRVPRDRFQGIGGLIAEAVRASAERAAAGSDVNVSGRVNRAIVVNVGGDRTSQAASSRQRARIRQDPGGGSTWVEETRERLVRRQKPGDAADEPGAPGGRSDHSQAG